MHSADIYMDQEHYRQHQDNLIQSMNAIKAIETDMVTILIWVRNWLGERLIALGKTLKHVNIQESHQAA